MSDPTEQPPPRGFWKKPSNWFGLAAMAFLGLIFVGIAWNALSPGPSGNDDDGAIEMCQDEVRARLDNADDFATVDAEDMGGTTHV